jgi:hypothetical protein
VPRLGEILVALGATTPAQVRAAIENQLLLGGRLGTNLLELGAVTEEALARALSQRHRLPAVSGDRDVEPAVLALLRPELVNRLEVLPSRLVGRRLEVLVVDPTDLTKLDQVAFAAGKQVHPVVVPEARLWALLQRHYGISRQLRGIVLGEDEIARARASAPVPTSAGEDRGASDLMGEEEFTALYASESTSARWIEKVAPKRAGPVAPPSRLPPNLQVFSLPGVPAGEWTKPLPATSGSPAPTAAPLPAPSALDGSMVSNDEVLAELQTEATARTVVPATPIALGSAVALEPPPLAFRDAVAALSGVADRNAIARTVLCFARSRFRRAVLLSIHGDLAEGWDGVGDGVSPQVVARMRLRISQPGILDTVIRSRAHFLGPLARTEQNIQLLRALGRGAPKNAFAVPVLARGRVVNVLYADAGRGALVDVSNVGELLILASRIAQSYETLLAQGR